MVSEPGSTKGLFAIYSSFVDLKVHEGLYLVCLTLHLLVKGVVAREGGC